MPIFSDTVDSWDDDEELARLKDELPDDNFLFGGFDEDIEDWDDDTDWSEE